MTTNVNPNIRRAAARIAANLTPESDLYLPGLQLAQEANISLVLAKYHLKRAIDLIAEGKDPLKDYRGGKRANQGWKLGRKRGPRKKNEAPE